MSPLALRREVKPSRDSLFPSYIEPTSKYSR
jgi:hypothetical protein